MYWYISSSSENTEQAIFVKPIYLSFTSVKRQIQQDSPNPVSIPIKCYLTFEQKGRKSKQFPQLRNS